MPTFGPKRTIRRCAGEACTTLVSGGKLCLECRAKRDAARKRDYDHKRWERKKQERAS